MADNLSITPGTGAVVATDDVGSAHYQKIKVAIGADGVVDGLLSQPLTNTELRATPVPVSVGAALPAGTNNVGDVGVVSQPGLTYTGEESITQDGASKACTLPANTNMIEITAEGGAVRYSINGSASANSGGYIPDGQGRVVYHIANLTSLAVFGASAAVKAHMLYYQEP